MRHYFLMLPMMAALTSCYHAPYSDDAGEHHTITGSTRAAASADVNGPISIYAMTSSGHTVTDSTTIADATQPWQLHVGDGDWTFAARTAWPYYYGQKQLGIDGDVETSIIVSPAIAKVDFALSGFMADSKGVTVEMQNIYSRLLPDGTYTGTTTQSLPLAWADTAWVAEGYAMPSRSDLTLYISYNDTTWLYRHDEPLLAGYRYHFRGHYTPGHDITGWIIVGDWLGDKIVDFTWGAVNADDSDDPQQGTEGSDTPAPGATQLLLASRVFADIHSALNTEGYAGEAAAKASNYSEPGYPAGTWRIPTKDEARALRTAAPNPSDPTRYLCEDATYTFTFDPAASITKAGSKSTYSLLLVTEK